MSSIPREEHPRPDFMRDSFATLDGDWQFAFDDADEGLAARWYLPGRELPLRIRIPFCYQSKASGVGGDEIHPILWYRRAFIVPVEMRGQNLLLRFGAVDWACEVYVNGVFVGGHAGGYTPFALDITRALKPNGEENDLCLRVVDAPDCAQPRGKQYWRRGLMGCWYTPVSGVWQSVYLEAVGQIYIRRLLVRPDLDLRMAEVFIGLSDAPCRPLKAEIALSFEGNVLRTYTIDVSEKDTRFPMDMHIDAAFGGVAVWSPEHPSLYDLSARILDGDTAEDHVRTYFGMRKIEVRGGHVRLNNEPLYQRLVLDQGYWPDTLLTPPDGEALRADVEWTKRLGYNGARKHQKIEDPRYYYWADKLGLLVWGELPAAYAYTPDSVRMLSDTMLEFIERDFNHPSIIAWVPLNESWGVPQILTSPEQQAFSRALYHLTKAADGTRLVSANDGWEQTTTDICALHDYTASGADLAIHFATREQVDAIGCDVRPTWAQGETPTGEEAFLVTEYGGIAFENVGLQGEIGGMSTWGYNGKVQSEADFLARFQSATDALRAIPYCRGYCYTQLTDVMQEINGLLTPERKPKIDPEALARINRNPDSR